MAYVSVYKGVVFIEGYEPSARLLGRVEYDKRFSYNAQLKTLDSVKEQLAGKAVAMGANAVVEFTYGQKSSGWFKSVLLSLDDNIKWYGYGMAAIIPQDRIAVLLENQK